MDSFITACFFLFSSGFCLVTVSSAVYLHLFKSVAEAGIDWSPVVIGRYSVIGDQVMVCKKADQIRHCDARRLNLLINSYSHSLSLSFSSSPHLSFCLLIFNLMAKSFATLLVSGILGHPSLTLCKSCSPG